MFKKIYILIVFLLFQNCSEFIETLENPKLPNWETEVNLHLVNEKISFNDKITDSTIYLHECSDTTFCDSTRGDYYVMSINEEIETIKVGNSLEFNDISKSYSQSINDVQISPLTTNLDTEIGIIMLGEMEPQSTPNFVFSEIMPANIIDLAEVVNTGGNSEIFPEAEFGPIENEFTFNSFNEVVISSSIINITITNNMFIVLGDTINIELRHIITDDLIETITFSDPIPAESSATEVINLNNTTLPGKIKLIIDGKTLGSNGVPIPNENEEIDLDSGFYVTLSVIEMNVESATANIPTQTISRNGIIEINQTNPNIDLISANIFSGFIELSVINGIPLNSELILSIPSLTSENGVFTAIFQIDAASGTNPTIPTITTALPVNLADYTLDFNENNLVYNYTVTTLPDSVTIDRSDVVDVELSLQSSNNSGITFKSISGYFIDDIADISLIELDSETKIQSALIQTGQINLTVENGLEISAIINFSLSDFIDSTGQNLLSEILINESENTTTHQINLEGYEIRINENLVDNDIQYLEYTSSVSFDSEILQEINLNSSLNFNIEITDLSFKNINGILDPITVQPENNFEIPISLPEVINNYSSELEGFNFYNPKIELVIESDIQIPISIILNLNSFQISNSNITDTLKYANFDTLLILNSSTNENNFNLTNADNLLNIFPNRISADVSAIIGGGSTYGEISQDSELKGRIEVNIPFAFLVDDTLEIDLDFSEIKPIDKKIRNIQYAELNSIITSSLDLNFDLSALLFSDTISINPVDTILNNFSIKSNDTLEIFSIFDSTLFSYLVNDTTYLKPTIAISNNVDANLEPIPFIIYSTDSLALDVVAKLRVLIDSEITGEDE